MRTRHPGIYIHEFADVIGIPAQKWKGHCYEIACAIIEADLILDGEAVYGSWLGPIAEGSYFADRAGSAFVRHGWIADVETDEIIDPTRWVFENTEPYIYIGDNEEGYYDRGNDVFREIMFREKPIPEYDPNDRQLSLETLDEFDRIVLKHLLYEDREDFRQMSTGQYFYLANAPMSLLGPTAAPLYRLLIDNGLGALVPIDNRDMILGRE